MEKYKCIKDFCAPKYDENDSPTDEYIIIHKESIYEYTEGYIGESDIRLYLEDGDVDLIEDFDSSKWEVIGNIFDNPELLEGGE